MKLKDRDENDKLVWREVTWSDHAPGCVRCRGVDLDKSASFALACAQGAALIAEEMHKRQAPVVAEKRAEVKAWATKAGFDVGSGVSKDKLKQITKYVE